MQNKIDNTIPEVKLNYKPRMCSCGHHSNDHWAIPNRSCRKCHCKVWTYSEMLDVGTVTLGEQLREVLQRNYRETCPNCERLFSLSDLSYDYVDGKSRYRVVCHDCGEILFETNKDGEHGDAVSNFIDVLDE